jgi:hypothetical protein
MKGLERIKSPFDFLIWVDLPKISKVIKMSLKCEANLLELCIKITIQVKKLLRKKGPSNFYFWSCP